MSRTPLLSQPRVQRVLYPMAIGLLLIALWQWMVVAMELPPYLVPSPWLMLQTLVTDWAPLGNALLVTLKITVLSFVLATVASRNDSSVILSVTRSALPSGAQSVTSVCTMRKGEGTR